MLHRAKHGLITAKLGWTNSWMQLPLPLFLCLPIYLTNSLFILSSLLGPPICLKCHGLLPLFSSPLLSSPLLCILFIARHFDHMMLILVSLYVYIYLLTCKRSGVLPRRICCRPVSNLKRDTDLHPRSPHLALTAHMPTCSHQTHRHSAPQKLVQKCLDHNKSLYLSYNMNSSQLTELNT